MVQNDSKKIDRTKIFRDEPIKETHNPEGITTARGKTPPKEDKS